MMNVTYPHLLLETLEVERKTIISQAIIQKKIFIKSHISI